MAKLTQEQIQDPHFQSYEKQLLVRPRLDVWTCGECDGPCVALPALTMEAPMTGTVVCPRCWHPVVGRMLATFATCGGWGALRSKKWIETFRMLVKLGLLKKRGRYGRITPAGLAVLWLKESVGWEFEIAHVRGWYRTENFPGSGPYTGYFHNEGKTGQFIPHMPGRHTKVWPLKGIAYISFGSRAA